MHGSIFIDSFFKPEIIARYTPDILRAMLVTVEVANAPAWCGPAVGLDLGLTRLATLSTGEILANPREGRRRATAIADAARSLARARRSSKRRLRLKQRLASLRRREANARATALHQQSAALVRRFATIVVEDLGISPRAHAVLTTAMTGELTQSEIARIVGLDKTTMVVTVDELEAEGLAERRPSLTDRRARVSGVTEAGKGKAREADKVLDHVRDDVLGVLDPDERDVFLRALGRLACGRLAEPVRCSHPVRRRG